MSQAQSAGAIVVGTKGNFDAEVLRAQVPVVVDFWAVWCVFCRKLAPSFQQAASKGNGKIKFVTANVDDEREVAERFAIMSLPTLKWFCGGREVGEILGAMGASELDNNVATMEQHARDCRAGSSALGG